MSITESESMPAPLEQVEQPAGLQRLLFHPVVRDLGLTGTASFLSAIAALLVISLIGKSLGPALLGEYLLVRRMASWLQAVVALPSGVALPRYVAASLHQPLSTRQAYFIAGFLTALGSGLLLALIIVGGKGPLSRILFGNEQLIHLSLPLALLLIGLAMHGAVFGYYQGALAMGRASVLQIINLVGVPLLATVVLMRSHSVSLIVSVMGVAMIIGALFFAVPIFMGIDLDAVTGRLKTSASELFSYGAARIPGDFGLQALLSLPALIAARYVPISSVSFLLLGGSFLAIVAAVTLPLGTILLSRVSRSMALGQTPQLQSQITHFVMALIALSAFACLQMIVFADVIVRIWVGPRFTEGIGIIRITLLAVPFYFLYAGVRSVIDAAAVKAYNTLNIFYAGMGFVIAVVLAKIALPAEYLLQGLAISTVIGLAILAGFTLRTLRKLFQIHLERAAVMQSLVLSAALGFLAYSLHRWIPYGANFAGLLVIELAIGVLYLLMLRLTGSSWLFFFLKTMLPGFSFNRESLE